MKEYWESICLGVAGGSLTCAMVSGMYALLLISILAFMAYIMCSDLGFSMKDTIFHGMDGYSHAIPSVNLLDCVGERLLFIKNGLYVYEKIQYLNVWYTFVTEAWSLDLHTYTPKENLLLAYPGVLYQKIVE